MSACRAEIARLLWSEGGAIAARDHPRLARTLSRVVAEGLLRAILPGVFVPQDQADDFDVRIRAAVRWAPNGVLTARAAARWTYWPDLTVPQVTMVDSGRCRTQPGFKVERERIPRDLVMFHRGALLTVPALTALDLVADCGGSGIDHALRTRSTSLAEMADALDKTPNRRGNRLRRQFLYDSRDEPWSEAERIGHALLHRAGIVGWTSNTDVFADGRGWSVDIVFRRLRIAVEIDGYEFHNGENRQQFHRDRRKWTTLTAAGWRVLHFTWEQLDPDPEWVLSVITATLARAESDIRRQR